MSFSTPTPSRRNLWPASPGSLSFPSSPPLTGPSTDRASIYDFGLGDYENASESAGGDLFSRRSRYASPVSTAGTLVSRPRTASSHRSRMRTSTPSILGQSEAHDIICALSEARQVSPLVGIALFNMTLGEVVLSQICDNQSYVKTIHKLRMASPSRIIFSATLCPPNQPSTLYLLVEDMLPESQIAVFERSAWSESAGLDHLQTLGIQGDIEPIKVAIEGKFYVVPCFAAVMNYIDRHFSINFAPHSLRIKYEPSDNTMMIDISAIKSLEIMQNSRNPTSKDSLFGLLNHTLTPMGSRMLRSNVLQPPTSHEVIRPRHDALEEMVTNEEMFRDIRKLLKSFHDTEKLLTKLITIHHATAVNEFEEQITQVLMIKSFLEAVPELHRALGPAQSNLLVHSRNICRPEITAPILHNIRRVIEPDVTYMKSPLDLRNQRAFAVRSGISGMLDVARRTYKELTEEIHKYVAELNDQYKLCASLKFDNSRKYWLRIRTADLEDETPPDILINVVPKKVAIECQTLGLVKLNQRLSDASDEVVTRSHTVILSLVRELRTHVSDLFKVCESAALIDMIASFAQLATTRDYMRPEIGIALALKAARHPVLEKAVTHNFVPNDYYATEQYCFHLVTGCNMSGKSTYIRTVSLLQIMAQIGSFVPAEYAVFPIIHNIFARVSTDDNIEASLSTFSVEMREMAFILKNMDGRSLVIIDELGRGTGTRDGLSISFAMCEALIESRASVWFATHFVELTRFFRNCSNVLNLHLESDMASAGDGTPQMIMRYKATAGTVDAEQHYGINLARAMGLPASLIQKAEEVANDLRQKREASQRSSASNKAMLQRKIMMSLYEALKQAMESGSEEALPGYLAHLQKEFILRMAEIEEM